MAYFKENHHFPNSVGGPHFSGVSNISRVGDF